MAPSLLLAALVQLPGPTPELAPGTRYDPSIPTVESVVGHDPRAEITPPADIVRYFETLAEAAPERTRLVEYARSWEGRPLIALLIASPERMRNLEAVRADLDRLAHPDGLSDEEAEALLGRLPVVTALMHGVHGNEISSSGAAMAEAYHLLAAQGDPVVDLILQESLVVIDPVENPDGRNRFVMQNRMARSRWPDLVSYSASHDEPWPGGRVNHYLFDLNRDLFIQSQPETAGKVELFLEWWPQIVVDFHEMGGDATYFFPPTAEPYNPWFTERQEALMDVFGRANAAAFDARGFAYFNRDVYDAFYPGYVDMWPMSHGALGMTYEQASARSLALLQSDGDTLTYGDGVVHHFTAALATAETAARNRERILRDYLAFRREGIAAGRDGPPEYILHSDHDPGRAERLARLLVRNGIRVHRAAEPVVLRDRTLTAEGTFIVPLDQPASSLVRDLLDPHVPMDDEFLERQRERRARRERDEIYDLTAWSQSLLWDVDAYLISGEAFATGLELEAERPEAAPRTLRPATVGYLIPWGVDGAAAVAEALREGIRVRAAGAPFELDGREYGVGTAIVRTSENGPDLPERLGAIAARWGLDPMPVDESYVSVGTSLGARSVRALREPKVMLVWDEPGQTYSVGWARYVLEQRYGVRTTAIRASEVGSQRLADWDVIVLPSGSYGGVFGAPEVARMRVWLRDGGTLVTMAGSSVWATGAGLLSTDTERRGGRLASADPPTPGTPEQPIDFLEAIDPADEAPENVPGAILRVILDTDHWLTAGTDGEIGALTVGTRVFRPLTLDDGTNVGRYAGVDDLVSSGVVWADARPQLANKAFLMHESVGRGQIVAFAEDPNYRAYTEATSLLFINAVLLGPGR